MARPVIILVRPQLVENIGTAARAMLNCGLAEMRLVAPRDPWPVDPWIRERMVAAASGADIVLDNAQCFDDLRSAVADLHYVYATTSRTPDIVKMRYGPRAAIADLRQRMEAEQKVGILFGPERTGLINEDLTHTNAIITIPTNPDFSSLNLAQCVLLIAYEWRMTEVDPAAADMRIGHTSLATKDALHNLFNRLEAELDVAGFFTTPELRPGMVRSLRNALQRAEMTDQEVRTWQGVVTALVDGPKRRNK